MNRFKTNISVLFISLAVIGLLFSMAHYHSEGLECVHHANEMHYTDSDPFCPVCTIVIYTITDDKPDYKAVLEFQETIIAVQEVLRQDELFHQILGRSPPKLV